jgi:hypothetical protein
MKTLNARIINSVEDCLRNKARAVDYAILDTKRLLISAIPKFGRSPRKGWPIGYVNSYIYLSGIVYWSRRTGITYKGCVVSSYRPSNRPNVRGWFSYISKVGLRPLPYSTGYESGHNYKGSMVDPYRASASLAITSSLEGI